MDEYLTNNEKQLLIKLASNKTTMIALKKVLLAPVYGGVLSEGQEADPNKNYLLAVLGNVKAIDDKYIGQLVRATIEGITLIETGFNTIEALAKPVVEEEEKINEAR